MQDEHTEAGALLARRTSARKRLDKFIEYVDDRYQDSMPEHVPFLCRELEEVIRYIETGNGTEFLVIGIPPGHLKTTVVSDYLSAWFHGRNPDMSVIAVSYSSTLVQDSSRRVRDMIEGSSAFDSIFGKKATFHIDDEGNRIPEVMIDRDTRAADKWKIDGHRGEHHAVGIGGTVTGRRAQLIIIDDPHASRQSAESQAETKAVVQFFRSTLYSRRHKNGAIVIIMQLWNKKDLVGWLRKVTDPNDPDYIAGFPPIKFVFLAALAVKGDPMGRQPGEALWPAFQDRTELLKAKSVMGDYYFNSQYQQQPADPEGTIFKRDWFRVAPKTEVSYKIQYWDTAEKDKQDNDYWCGVTLGVTKYGILLLDIKYKKMTTNDGMEEIYRTYDEWNTEEEPVAVVWLEEKSSGGPLLSIMRAAERTIPVDGNTPKGDKVARANSVTGVCSARRVQVLQHAPWIADFLEEMTAFPNGDHDDLPDAVVGGVSKLVHGGHVRVTDSAKAQQKKQERRTDTSLPPTHEERSRDVFGHDGRGAIVKKRGRFLRRPPAS